MRRRSGFSLIEILFAVAILASGFLLVMGMFPTSFRGVHQGKHRLVANQLAQAYMDRERSKSFNTMSSTVYNDNYTTVVNGVSSSAAYRTTVRVTPGSGTLAASNKALIEVQTEWVQTEVTGQNAARSVQMSSTRTRAF